MRQDQALHNSSHVCSQACYTPLALLGLILVTSNVEEVNVQLHTVPCMSSSSSSHIPVISTNMKSMSCGKGLWLSCTGQCLVFLSCQQTIPCLLHKPFTQLMSFPLFSGSWHALLQHPGVTAQRGITCEWHTSEGCKMMSQSLPWGCIGSPYHARRGGKHFGSSWLL